MKTFLSFTVGIILFTSMFLFQEKETDPNKVITIEGKITNAILKTSNGCGVGNFLIPVSGDSVQGTTATIGSLSDDSFGPTYMVLDEIPGSEIKGVAFKKEGDNNSLIEPYSPYRVISNVGIYSYDLPDDFSPYYFSLSKIDSFAISGISKMASQTTTEPIVLYVEDALNQYSLQFYSYQNLQELYQVPFYFEPEIFEVTNEGLFITGLDTTGNYMLYHYSTTQDSLFGKYELNNEVANGQEILVFGESVYMLSSPGDSITMLSTLNLLDSSLVQTVINTQSGARATYNDYKNNKLFTFQSIEDIPNGFLDKQILLLDPLTNDLDTLVFNLEFDYFKYPKEAGQGFGFYSLEWIGSKIYDGTSDTIFLSNYSETKRIGTSGSPQYINATFGCWVSVHENELEEIKFEYFPNPASSQVTINLSGLQKGRIYQLKIIDNAGKVLHQTQLSAYEEIQLPLQDLVKGIYYLNLDTGKNKISKKLIIQ